VRRKVRLIERGVAPLIQNQPHIGDFCVRWNRITVILRILPNGQIGPNARIEERT